MDRRQADHGNPDGPERRGVLIGCPDCDDRVPITSGYGPVGDKTWVCRNGHAFNQHDRHAIAHYGSMLSR